MRPPVIFALVVAAAASGPQQLRVDPSSAGLPYDGHGALSAGASSRLLYDYELAVSTKNLDYLFKPKFGASLNILKSSDGTESSHMHSRGDLNCARG